MTSPESWWRPRWQARKRCPTSARPLGFQYRARSTSPSNCTTTDPARPSARVARSVWGLGSPGAPARRSRSIKHRPKRPKTYTLRPRRFASSVFAPTPPRWPKRCRLLSRGGRPGFTRPRWCCRRFRTRWAFPTGTVKSTWACRRSTALSSRPSASLVPTRTS